MAIRKTISRFLLILCIFCISAVAQVADKNEPYKVGEILEYEGKFSRLIFRGIDIATLNFRVENSPDDQNFIVKAEARSQGGLIKLFDLKFNQTIESTVDGDHLRILRTAKRDEQDDRVRVSEALFDYEEEKVSYIESDPTDKASAPRVVASSVESKTQDIVSAIYMLRYAPLAVGQSFDMTVSDGGLVYRIPVRVTKREKRKSVLGKKWCFRVEPQVFGPNRLIESKGKLVIWITDDEDRVPVRANINISIGKVVVKLKKFGNRPNPTQTAK